MAFISHNGVLSRDLWPRKITSLPNDYENALSLPKWRCLPDAYEQMCDRILVEGSTSSAVRVYAVHPELPGRMQLAVRLQGIVGDVQIGPKGDWDGNVDHAVKAMQSLTLVNEGCHAAFAQQRSALRNVEEYILTMLRQGGRGFRSGVTQKGAIRLRRRAFSKAKPGVPQIELGTSDDNGSIASMAHQWVVDHMVKASILHPSGVVTRVHPTAIRRGDLVDVAATVEVVNMRGRGGWHSEIMVSPNHVLRLKTANDIRAEEQSAKRASAQTSAETTEHSLPDLPVELGLEALHGDDEDL